MKVNPLFTFLPIVALGFAACDKAPEAPKAEAPKAEAAKPAAPKA